MAVQHANAVTGASEKFSLDIITGQYADFLIEALRLEANIPSYATHSDRLASISYEKVLRLPEDHPRHAVAIKDVSNTGQSEAAGETKTLASLAGCSTLMLTEPHFHSHSPKLYM